MFYQFQQSFLLFALFGVSSVVNAHGRVRQWTITRASGETQVKPGQDYNVLTIQTAQRLKDNANKDDPLYLLEAGPLLACNSPATSAGETWSVDPGDIVTPYWSHAGGYGGQPPVGGFWPTGHSGPAINYMAACPASGCNGFLASQADWFKISEDITYEGLWVTEKIFKDGQWPIKMPAALKPGEYLLRHEIMSVHGREGSPQIYPACIQIKLGGSGTTVPKTVKILDAYQNYDQTYMHYQPKTTEGLKTPEKPFFCPGPPVYDGSGGGAEGGVGYSGTAAANATLADSDAVAASLSSSYAAAGYTSTDSYLPNPNAPAPTVAQSDISSVVDPLTTAAVATSVPAGVTSFEGSSTPVATSQAGSTARGGPASPSISSPAVAAGAANPSPSVDIKMANKGVVNNAAAGGDAAAVKSLPASYVGDAAADAGQATSAITSANAGGASASDPSATTLAAGADSPVVSVTSDSAVLSATTGISDYASNIQGGACQVPSWRCQKYANGTDFLEVCNSKKIDVVSGGTVYGWSPSQPLCPIKCDDSKPQSPDCQ